MKPRMMIGIKIFICWRCYTPVLVYKRLEVIGFEKEILLLDTKDQGYLVGGWLQHVT